MEPFTPQEDYDWTFYNFAFTSDVPFNNMDHSVVPEADYVYDDIIDTRQVDLYGTKNNVTDERFFDFPTYANGFYDMMTKPLDITVAEYIEFDFYSDKAGTVWMSLGSAHMHFEFYDNRSLHKSFTVNEGWNHVVLTTDGEYREADSTTFMTYNPEMVTGFILHSVDAGYVRLTNVALTSYIPQGYNDVPVPDYVYEDIVATRQVDLKGSQNNFTDERFFDYPTYAFAFRYMMMDPFDITAAKYLEFDFYSDKAGTVWMSLGSAEFPFEFYDNRSLHKSFTVNAGWNHIVLTTDGEYREFDSTTLKTYNPEMVTGFILHSVDADYISLTNVALTYSVSQGDTVLNYRSDFDLGAVMHAPQWSTSYREENLELQIKQLKEMGGSLLRVDAVDNFPHLDKTVKLCNAYGIKVMLIVYIPGRTFDPTVQVDLDAIREYYRMYATRYDGKHGCGKIDYIQIDNEMDVAIMGLFEMCGTGSEISEYPEPSLRKITEQVKAASLGIADANTDIKRVLNIAWVHYGILKYFQQEGVEWDVTGHDWYQDMFDYGNDPSDCYNSGQELYDLFKKPIIICETNMWMNYYYNYDNGTIDPDYKKSSWWDPLVEAIKDYYDKDFVIGCTVYEFYDEPNNFGGGGHFGINEVNADGSFKSHKPIYFILQQMFEGETVEQENWQEVEREYSVREDTDMRSLIAIKNALLEDNGIYKSEYDLEIDGRVDSRDYTFLRKYLFENL